MRKRFMAPLFLVLVGVSLCAVIAITLFYAGNEGGRKHPNTASQPLTHQQFEEINSMLTELVTTKDAKASLDFLRGAIRTDTALARECHTLLHHVGRLAYEKYGDFDTSMSYQDELCNSGYTHGVIEAYFIASDDIQKALQTACSRNAGSTSFRQWQCYHGVGHGIMYFTDKELGRSLTLCSNLTSDFARNSCINGVFMERFIVSGHFGTPAKNVSELTTESCRQQTENDKYDCYFYAPTAYLEVHINDYTGAFEDCQKHAEQKHIATCINGVGSQATKENISSPDTAREICQEAPKEHVNTCIDGAIGLLINHHASTDPVAELCTTTFQQFSTICTQKIKLWHETYVELQKAS